ncbi:retrotransposon protein, putative, ty1-copia subclass [Tanacetum coccineum]|uniref:Retrotransposon protein, putative, ty1-copia subclass n=1 Tax=Tanacetum coccineum TaxID=301880 RepID=A0ABQ4ZR48_9ASTR
MLANKRRKNQLAHMYLMKGCVEQLEHLGYVLPQYLSVGLIMNGLTSDFAGFVKNYNMHNMGKTIGELHALLIEYEKVICLDNCHYAPTITRGVVLVSRLVDNGFIQCFTDDGISVSKNDVLYFNAIPRDGKMTRKSFSHRTERATDLLGLIHTDVCGPLRHVSRQGASYFITFTDDYSRYGYVYLLKHKHEVFKTFKVFKNEVENQLGKTIKSLRSDQGGEYISQQFKDYLKACGIV